MRKKPVLAFDATLLDAEGAFAATAFIPTLLLLLSIVERLPTKRWRPSRTQVLLNLTISYRHESKAMFSETNLKRSLVVRGGGMDISICSFFLVKQLYREVAQK